MEQMSDRVFNQPQCYFNPEKIDAETAEKLKTFYTHTQHLIDKVDSINYISASVPSEQLSYALQQIEPYSDNYIPSESDERVEVVDGEVPEITGILEMDFMLYNLRNVLPTSNDFVQSDNLLMQCDFSKDTDANALQGVYGIDVQSYMQDAAL